jgi:hypothetical protein
MSANHRSLCAPPTAIATASDSKKLITKHARSRKIVKHVSEVPPVIDSSTIPRLHRNGNRIGINQRTRILQKYVAGKTKIDIAKEEGVDRESVRRIVRCPEMDAYVEEKRELWRGLCDPALEVVRQKLKEGDKEVALRVLESNGVIPPRGATLNHNIQTAAKPTGDERVKNLRAAFADVMLERAKAFKTPFPELAQIAEQHNIEVGLDLRGASDEAEEDES